MSFSYFGNTRFDYHGKGRELFKIYFLARFLPLLAAGLVAAVGIGFAWAGALLPRSPALIFAVILVAQLLAVVIFLGTLPLFNAARDRYVWSHTTFATARFRSTVTAGRLYGLYLGDIVRLVPTFGLAFPWVVVRHVRFRCANLVVEGPLDLAAIQQDAQAASAVGEGLGDFFGMLEFDLGL